MALDIITGQNLLPDFIWPATVVIVFLFAVGILHWPTIACRTWMHFRPSAYPVFLSQAKTPILWEPTISHYSSFFFLIHANIEIIKLRQIHSNDFSFWFMIHHKIKYQVLKQARECFFFIVHVCAFEKSDKKNITITVAYFLLFWQRSAIVLGR